jgi:hypothetical protein
MRTMSVLLPPGTGRVEVQAATEGEGTSWFDDIVVQIVAQDSLPPASELAAEYVSDAIDTIRAHSLRSKEVDWGRVRALAARRVRGANRPCETWPAITEVFEVIGESHGWHSTPSEVAWYATNQVGDGAAPLVAAHTFPGRVGFLSVPRVPTTDSASVNRVASAIQDMVREHGQLGVCRWVVDLRDNSGGNMWPMLTGLGWLLGDGVAGAFVGSDRARFWGYENDASYLDGIAVAFRGRPRSRSFGQPTAGLTTATSSYGLSDGSNLTFATSVFADRAGTHYGGPLSPDIEIESGRLGAVGDPVLDGALDWLRSISCTS